MGTDHFMRSRSLKRIGWIAFVGIAATVAAGADSAQARTSRHHHAARSEPARQHRVVHGPSYHPRYAAIVVDDKSGEVLHQASPDEPRHPASLTKIMTLYLVFEQLEAGGLKLDTQMPISFQASIQNPTKLGLKVGATLSVDDAIRGLVTKSANDAAVVVAEAIGGSESEFARLMTRKARALGMANTTYVNASGLPAEEQITTARDQAILGRAIQHRFPNYYPYFATASFRYRGTEMRNHNALLGQVQGVDGIKTGYTEASGYNLVCSVRRGDHHIVAVVLGGTSNAARDARMRQLIEQHVLHAATERTAPIVTELGEDGLRPSVVPVTVAAPEVAPTPAASPVQAAAPARAAAPVRAAARARAVRGPALSSTRTVPAPATVRH